LAASGRIHTVWNVDIIIARRIPMAIENNFQRIGAKNNTEVGREFQTKARRYFASQGIVLEPNVKVSVGSPPAPRLFSLGSHEPPILVMCKSLKWTGTENTPSAKIKTLNTVAMLFGLCDPRYRRIIFMLKDLRKGESLARYFVRTQGNLIGPGVEVWDFDPEGDVAERVH
jgi:hypothetical protein